MMLLLRVYPQMTVINFSKKNANTFIILAHISQNEKKILTDIKKQIK
jgi:hypothetical protein